MEKAEKRGRRWVVRSAIVGGALLPLPTLLAYGCDSPTQFDDLCGWVRDPNNCYGEFFEDVGAKCGVVGTTKPGEFASRDKLGECFLAEGGIVVFEPPLSLTAEPGTGEEPQKVKLINPDQTECGNIEFRAKYDFSVFINGDPLPDAGVDANDLPDEFIEGGLFNMQGGKTSDSLAVTCPDASAFNFNRLQITRCPEYEQILPHVEIEYNPGGIETTGVIRLNVFYPPVEGELANANPEVVNYFECFIPGGPPPCENGVKDGAETDIDCGGGFCTARCDDGQLCNNDDDCLSSSCIVDMGLKKCSGGA